MGWEQGSQSERPVLRPLAVGDILDITFRLYRENFLAFVKIAAVGVIPAQILTWLLLSSAIPDDDIVTRSTDAFGNRTTVDVNTDDLWRVLSASLGTVVLGIVASLVVTAAITKAVAHYYVDGQKPAVGESLRAAVGVLIPLIGMTILLVLGVALGTLACIIPGVFLFVAWSVASPALIMEHAGPAGALGRSMTLVRPRWWPTFGLILLVWLMTTIATQIISLPLAFVAGEGGFFQTPSSSSDLASLFVGYTIAGIIAGLLTTPFSAIVVVVLYVDLRVRHEGFDIQVLAAAVGATEPTPDEPHVSPQPAPPNPPPAPPEHQWGMPPSDPSSQ